MPSDATRESLLDAAKRVIQRDGAGNLTLDAVAKEAKVSKGGLLYHFPSKVDLLRGLVEHGMEMEEQSLASRIAAAKGPRPWTQTFIEHALSEQPKECKPPPGLVWAVLGAAANDPTLLEPIHALHDRWERRLLDEGLEPAVATLLMMVGHGLWATEMFAQTTLAPGPRADLHRLLVLLAGSEAKTLMEEH